MRRRASTRYICIHCSATKPYMDIGAEAIRRWHVDNRGFADCGYHLIIRRNGQIEQGRDLWRVGAHEPAINHESVAPCLVGGLDSSGAPAALYTPAQWSSLDTAIDFLQLMYPHAKIVGHNQFSNKACPSFDVEQWLIQRNS